MELPSNSPRSVDSSSPRFYGLPVTEGIGALEADAERITEELIHDVVMEFYRRARRDESLGPVFEQYVHDWDTHLARMTDFWSSVLLRTGRYSGAPVERHRAIDGLGDNHFGRWIELFDATVHDLCAPPEAEAFLFRARRMREGMTRILGLAG